MSSWLFFSQSHDISPYIYGTWYSPPQSRASLCEFLELSPCISLLSGTLLWKMQQPHFSKTGLYPLKSMGQSLSTCNSTLCAVIQKALPHGRQAVPPAPSFVSLVSRTTVLCSHIWKLPQLLSRVLLVMAEGKVCSRILYHGHSEPRISVNNFFNRFSFHD